MQTRDLSRLRTPTELTVSPTHRPKIALLGACVLSHIGDAFKVVCEADVEFVHFGGLLNGSPALQDDPKTYDFALFLAPMDFIAPVQDFFRANAVHDRDAAERFAASTARLNFLLDKVFEWAAENSLALIVGNFLLPVQNPIGRLQPRYDLRNPIFFTEELNRTIGVRVQTSFNTFMLDLDAIAASYGRIFIQDDPFWTLSHGGVITDSDVLDYESKRGGQGRIEPIVALSTQHQSSVGTFLLSAAREAVAIFRTTQHIDTVKLVITDLDDTLWRGVMAEREVGQSLDYLDAAVMGGVPFGYLEALSILKKRGIMLAIASKNDHAKVSALWPSLLGDLLPLEAFVSVKIEWRSKAETIAEILSETNILPRNVVFVDDNPRERAEVAQAFPTMRILGDDFYWIRSILLWSAETQIAALTEESGNRTEMVRQQIVRETERKAMSGREFLVSLDLRVSPVAIGSKDHGTFPRALELLNKTNQFNTTGRRWTNDELASTLTDGGQLWAFSAEDRFTNYGTVAIGLLHDNRIEHFVMSCRVIGLGLELAALHVLETEIASNGSPVVVGISQTTDANTLSRDLFARAHYALGDTHWTKSANEAVGVPDHITLI